MDLNAFASASSIATFVFGAGAYCHYRFEGYRKRRRLENYLKRKREEGRSSGKKGQQSVMHLIRHLCLTENEVIQLSFRSRHIEPRTAEEGEYAGRLLFVYVD